MCRSRFVISHATRIRSIFFITSKISTAMNATEAITCYRDANAKEKYSKQDRKRISMSCEDRAGRTTTEKFRWYSMGRHRNSIVVRYSSPEYYENFVTNFHMKLRLCMCIVRRRNSLKYDTMINNNLQKNSNMCMINAYLMLRN